MYKKNNAMLNAGKIKPTSGVKIEGKKAAAIFFYYLKVNVNTYLVLKILIPYCI